MKEALLNSTESFESQKSQQGCGLLSIRTNRSASFLQYKIRGLLLRPRAVTLTQPPFVVGQANMVNLH